MNKKLLTSLSLTLVLATVALADEPKKKELPSCCSMRPAPALAATSNTQLSDISIYQLESNWTNDTRSPIQLKSLRGKPQVITLFFAKCTYACPLLVYDMQRIEAALPPEIRKNVGFTLITIDVERDTPEVLNAYRISHQMGTNWTLLRGNNDDVLELAALLGVKFKKEQNGQFAHSNVITILNSEGEIVTQQIGLNRDPAASVTAIENLLEG